MSTSCDLAKKLMEIIPPSMNWIRSEMRSNANEELTVPQFRILASIFRGNNIACDIAKVQGTSQAAMSKMIDGLVTRGFVEREANSNDRRHFHLNLTDTGDIFFKKIRKMAQNNLNEQINSLGKSEKDDLARGLAVLEKLFLSAMENEN